MTKEEETSVRLLERALTINKFVESGKDSRSYIEDAGLMKIPLWELEAALKLSRLALEMATNARPLHR